MFINRPVYTQIQLTVHVNKKVIFLEKFSQTRGSAFYWCHFCRHGLLKSQSGTTGSLQKVWKQKTPLCWAQIQQEHLFPHCLGTFSISSFLFYFVLTENNLKIVSAQLPEKTCQHASSGPDIKEAVCVTWVSWDTCHCCRQHTDKTELKRCEHVVEAGS